MDVRLAIMESPFFILWIDDTAVLIQSKERDQSISHNPKRILGYLHKQGNLRERVFYMEPATQPGVHELVHKGKRFKSFAFGHEGYVVGLDRATIYLERKQPCQKTTEQ